MLPLSLSRLRSPVAALLALGALAGCTLLGGGETPQPQPLPQASAAPPIATAPLATTPLATTPLAPSVPATVVANKVGVGVLLPLSGPSAALGQAMLDAAEMALFDLGGDQIALLVRDSGGTPQAAAAAARSAIRDGARILLGPLLAAEVEGAKPVAADAHVPLVAFSTATRLAGDGTWLMSFDPRQEIERVVLYADHHGRTRFAALAPQGAYGDLAVEALRQSVGLAGANLGRIARYGDGGDVAPAVQAFAAGLETDAVLLPDGGARLKRVAPLLPFDGIDLDKVKLLGTGLWADSSIGTEPTLDGGWYAAPNPATRTQFEKRFETLYKRPPPLLATLGYDATALAAVLARTPGGPNFTAAGLTNPSGFSGLNGIFRLLPNGMVERGLAVLQVEHDGATVIDPAPQSFERPGS
ncbi:MAG: penicillin-binding protein activator [Stellaceae bacterium]